MTNTMPHSPESIAASNPMMSPITTIGEAMDFYERHHIARLKNPRSTGRLMRLDLAPLTGVRVDALTRHAAVVSGGARAATNRRVPRGRRLARVIRGGTDAEHWSSWNRDDGAE